VNEEALAHWGAVAPNKIKQKDTAFFVLRVLPACIGGG